MEFRPYYFAREWSRAGHRVTIAAASWTHLRRVNPTVGASPCKETIDGIHYIWFWTPRYSGNGIGRTLNIAVFLLQLILHFRLLTKSAHDGAVIASSTYPFDVVIAKWIAGAAIARLVYEVHDLWPLSPIELGGMSPQHPFIQAVQWAEDFAYKEVDDVVSMLPMAEPYMRTHGLAAGKFHYVPNGINLADWNESSILADKHRMAIAALKSANKFIIGYAGSHGIANSLDTILLAAKKLRDHPIVFVLVGQGPEKAALENLSANLALDNVVFLPPVRKAEVPALLAQMDCLLITLKRAWIFRLGISPNKLMDYMMAGRPIIQAIDAGNDIVAESRCGISVPAEDPDALAEAALRMAATSQEQCDEMGSRGKRYVEANHEYRQLAPLFLRILSQAPPHLQAVDETVSTVNQ
jgi:glycosyltransferase involved in cell wall biosynthesis